MLVLQAIGPTVFLSIAIHLTELYYTFVSAGAAHPSAVWIKASNNTIDKQLIGNTNV